MLSDLYETHTTAVQNRLPRAFWANLRASYLLYRLHDQTLSKHATLQAGTPHKLQGPENWQFQGRGDYPIFDQCSQHNFYLHTHRRVCFGSSSLKQVRNLESPHLKGPGAIVSL